MATEIERRFLVDTNRLPKLRTGKLQIQGYFNSTAAHQPEIRIRIEENKASLAFKTFITPVSRTELEYPIPLKDAKTLLAQTDKKVRKLRHHLKLDDRSWIIDFFQDENSPLVLAEIELKSENENFEKPLWTTKEVTNDLRYTAVALAFEPFTLWGGE